MPMEFANVNAFTNINAVNILLSANTIKVL